MQRREFVTVALSTAGGLAAFTSGANAASGYAYENLVFTGANPGHWAALAEKHVPVLKVEGGKLTATTPHPMSEAHYIVSHSVVLENGTFLGRATFNWKDKPQSTHTLPAGYKGKVSVASTCNQHDMWLGEITV